RRRHEPPRRPQLLADPLGHQPELTTPIEPSKHGGLSRRPMRWENLAHMTEARAAGPPHTPGPEAGDTLRRLAWPLGILGLVISAATATLVFLNHSAIHSIDQASPIGVILPIGFAIIGALLVSRQSRNTIGWIFLGIALFVGLN